ncbi:MAG: hypothetical protein ACYTFG_19480, partial [Planctomycetota bacterium]
LNPSVPFDRVTGAVEEGIFCIRIPKGAESRPKPPGEEKKKTTSSILVLPVRRPDWENVARNIDGQDQKRW